jgi:Ribbon-helix-helix protein, copG family
MSDTIAKSEHAVCTLSDASPHLKGSHPPCHCQLSSPLQESLQTRWERERATRIVYLGDDGRGRALEVMAIEGMTKFTTASGEVLTDEDIEALADEAERGHDLARTTKVTVGRPSLGARGISPRVQVRVDRDLAEALRARARKEHRSVSEIARTALREYVDRAA